MSDCEITELDPPSVSEPTLPKLITAKELHVGETCGKEYIGSKALQAPKGLKECGAPSTFTSEYTCTLCGRDLKGPGPLGDHKRKVHGIYAQKIPARTRTFICLFCGHKASDSGALSIHNRIHTGEKPFKCQGCGKRFIRKNNCSQHMRKCNGAIAAGVVLDSPKPMGHQGRDEQGWYKCSKCAFKSRYHRNKSKHEATHGEKFKCSLCPAGFKSSVAIAGHLKLEHPETQRQVELVEQDGVESSATIPASQRKRYKCGKCNYRAKVRRDMEHHEAIHGEEFKCPLCPVGFKFYNGLKAHKKMEHPELVPKKSVPKKVEKRHSSSGTAVKNQSELVQTTKTDPAFEGPGVPQLKNIVPSDETVGGSSVEAIGLRSYVCLFCDHDAKTASALTAHHRSHSDDKPAECKGCGKRFTNESSLSVHMRGYCKDPLATVVRAPVPKPRTASKIPYDQQKYKCAKCNYRTYHLTAKERHEACHGEEFKCPFCSVGFKFFNGLKAHKTMEHPEQVPGPKNNGNGQAKSGTEMEIENDPQFLQSILKQIKTDSDLEGPDEPKCEVSEDFGDSETEIEIKYEHDLHAGQTESEGLDNTKINPEFGGPNPSKCDQISSVFEDLGGQDGIEEVKVEVPPLTVLDVESKYVMLE